MRSHVTVVWISKEGRNIYVQGSALKRRNAASGDTGVDEALIAECEFGLFCGSESQSRINSIPLQIDAIPKALGVFIHPICAESHFVVEGLVKINRGPFVVEGTGQKRNLAQRRESRFLGHAVNHASASAAAEDHGVGTSQNLHAIQVVEIAI